jgi:hypothetical protein
MQLSHQENTNDDKHIQISQATKVLLASAERALRIPSIRWFTCMVLFELYNVVCGSISHTKNKKQSTVKQRC